MFFSELPIDSEEKHLRWSAAAIQTGALATGATHSFESASGFVSKWFCEALLAPRLSLRQHKDRLGTCGEDMPSTTS